MGIEGVDSITSNTYELGIEGIRVQWGELKGERVELRLPQREDGDLREIKETERQLGFQRGWLSRGVAAMWLLGGGRDNRLVIDGGCWSLTAALLRFEQPQQQRWLLR